MNTHSVSSKFKGIVAIVSIWLAAGVAWSSEHTLFYVVAHQDDWQLFMNPNAFYDAHVPDARVVFIYTTAGDAGLGTGTISGASFPYYRAREYGAYEAAKFVGTQSRIFCTGAGCYDARGGSVDQRRVAVNGRRIFRMTYRNTTSYFLRLPDGCLYGRGCSQPVSLQRLFEGEPIVMRDITREDNAYTREELLETLRAIVRREARGSSNVWVNFPYRWGTPGDGYVGVDEWEVDEMTEDHSDHIYTGRFMYEAIGAFSCVNWAEFLGYQSNGWAPNLSEDQLIWEAGTWGATISGLLRTDGAKNTFNRYHNAYLGRNIFWAHGGHGPCTSSDF